MKNLRCLPVLFLLILCVCLLTGCGKTEEAESPAVTASPEEDVDLVYTAHFQTIPSDPDTYPSYLGYTSDGVFTGVFTVIEKGEIPEGVTQEYEGQFDTYGERLYFVNLNGERKELEYVSGTGEEDGEGRKNFESGSSIDKIILTDDGQIIALERVYTSWFDGPSNMTEADPDYWDYTRYADSIRILRLDGDGKLLSSAKLDWNSEEHEDEWLNFNDALLADQERIMVRGQKMVYLFAFDASLASEIQLDDWTSASLVLRDGQLAVFSAGMGGPNLALLDTEKQSVSEKLKLDVWPEKFFTGSGDYDFFYTSGSRLYGYKMEEKSAEEIMNLLDCDLSADEMQWLKAGEEGTFLCYCQSGEELSLAQLRQVPRSFVAEKRVLTLGVLGSEAVEEPVLRFNKQHDDVRIQVVDYTESFNDNESDMDGLTRLSTEIMTGNMPDLLALSGMPFEQLASKGLLEDLYPWIDADPELSREDFLPNVLRAMEQGGKLCQVCSGFEINTLLGASSVVGEEPGWSFDELYQALSTMPPDCTVLGPYASSWQMLELCFYADVDSYVDWEKGSCDFDNEDFCALLAFCAGFPEEPDYYSDSGSDYGRISSGEQMLLQDYIYSLQDLGYADQYFGGKTTFIGFPVRSGSGSVMMLFNSIGMSSACTDKESAWEFLRLLLLPDYQRSQYNIPVRRDILQEQLEDEMRIEYQKNEDGQYLLDENGERIPVIRGGMSIADDNGDAFTYEYYGLTEEQAQRFLQLLEQTDKAPSYYTKLYAIVRTEAEPCFAGKRSPEETAKIIQNKVSLYLSEQN